MEHPFADAAKLKILNSKYSTPENPKDVSDFQPLIGELPLVYKVMEFKIAVYSTADV